MAQKRGLEEAHRDTDAHRYEASTVEEGRASSRKSKKSSKHASKDRKEKYRKHKSSRKKLKRSHSSSSSPSPEPAADPALQLQLGRLAVRTTRAIMGSYPAILPDFRALLRSVDEGEAVDLSGIGDAALRSLLAELFEALSLRRLSKGTAYVRTSHSPAVLSLLGAVLQEVPIPPPAHVATRQAAPDASSAAAPAHAEGPGPAVGRPSLDASSEPPPPAVRPASPPTEPGCQRPEGEASPGPTDPEPESEAGSPPARRVLGPAAPPPHIREAMQDLADEAAAAAAAQRGDGSGGDSGDGDGEPMVGPELPAFLQELEAVGQEPRARQVLQIMAVLGATTGGSEAADPYDVLGVPHDAPEKDIKGVYRRVSILTHPDKCGHKHAHEAFQAVSRAAKQLLDSDARQRVDADREAVRVARVARQLAEGDERARQWRVIRGEATAEDLAGPQAPLARDTWMSELPIARRAPNQPKQVNVTSFSRTGVAEIGDTSAWTDSPAMRIARMMEETRALPGAAAVGTVDPAGGAAGRSGRTGDDSRLVDQFNQASRPVSLLDQHREKEERRAKKAAAKRGSSKGKSGKTNSSKGGEEWKRNHPWRPFDRETDLGGAAKKLTPEEAMRNAGVELSNKFGSSNTRNFL